MASRYSNKSETHQNCLSAADSNNLSEDFARHTALQLGQAQQAQTHFTKMVGLLAEEIASKYNNTISFFWRIKNGFRALEKSSQKDLIAARIVVDNNINHISEGRCFLTDPETAPQNVQKFLKSIQFKSLSYDEHVDRMAEPTSFGYSGSLKFTGKMDIGGGRLVPYEIQLMPKCMLEIEDESHHLFELARGYFDIAEKAFQNYSEDDQTDWHKITCTNPAETIKIAAQKERRALTLEEQDEYNRLTATKRGAPISKEDWQKVNALRYANSALYEAQTWKFNLMEIRSPEHRPLCSLNKIRANSEFSFERDASYIIQNQIDEIVATTSQNLKELSAFEKRTILSLIEAVGYLHKDDAAQLRSKLEDKLDLDLFNVNSQQEVHGHNLDDEDCEESSNNTHHTPEAALA